ncbi:MAG TPA: LysM peptidoglycan-binding domain-containing protein, partial [bacterium]
QIHPDWHTVAAGENLSAIARKYGISLHELMSLNSIDRPHLIYAGQNLQIPSSQKSSLVPTVVADLQPVQPAAPTQLAEVDAPKKEQPSMLDAPPVTTSSQTTITPPNDKSEKSNTAMTYAPSKTPTYATTPVVSKKELTPVEVVELENRAATVEEEMALALPDFYVEMTRDLQTRVVRVPQHTMAIPSLRTLDFPQNGQVRVEPDETLGHFADWLEVATQRLRNINRLSYSEPIRIEQPLWLTFENVTPEEFHRRRLEYHQGIEEDFYNNYNVVGETSYRVRRGENIWMICNREFEFPYWLIKRYNPDTDLLRLTASQEIVVPVVEPKIPAGVGNEKR